MGWGGISDGTVIIFLIVVGVFVALVMAALVKYVFGLGKSGRNSS